MGSSDPKPDAFRQRYERRSDRVAVSAEVALRRSSHLTYRVHAYDVSQHGCRLEFVERPELDERVWVKFEGLNAIEGLVCWIDGFLVGIEFAQPIYPAVFDALVPKLR